MTIFWERLKEKISDAHAQECANMGAGAYMGKPELYARAVGLLAGFDEVIEIGEELLDEMENGPREERQPVHEDDENRGPVIVEDEVL